MWTIIEIVGVGVAILVRVVAFRPSDPLVLKASTVTGVIAFRPEILLEFVINGDRACGGWGSDPRDCCRCWTQGGFPSASRMICLSANIVMTWLQAWMAVKRQGGGEGATPYLHEK